MHNSYALGYIIIPYTAKHDYSRLNHSYWDQNECLNMMNITIWSQIK